MKKNILRIAVLLMAGSLLFMACKKSTQPTKPSTDTEKEQGQEGSQEEKPGGEEQSAKNPNQIVLDGTFADWDAITEEVAKSNKYVDMLKGGKDDPIQVLKISNDEENVYFYIEFKADKLPQNASCGSWGSSYSENALDVEMGPEDESFREVMHIFVDPDGNEGTGFFTFADLEDDEKPAIPGLGCEICAQFFMCFNPATQLAHVAFEQTLIGPDKVGAVGEDDQVDENGYTGDFDYNGTFCQSWPDEGDEAAFPLWGWQNPDDSGTGDNDFPLPDNWKPAKAEGGIAKVEFGVEKETIHKFNKEDEEFACGIIIDWNADYYQATGVLRITYVK